MVWKMWKPITLVQKEHMSKSQGDPCPETSIRIVARAGNAILGHRRTASHLSQLSRSHHCGLKTVRFKDLPFNSVISVACPRLYKLTVWIVECARVVLYSMSMDKDNNFIKCSALMHNSGCRKAETAHETNLPWSAVTTLWENFKRRPLT